jgi:isoleucyl-tRNA synthetase
MMSRQYPADFIAEGLDQTRGWFYSLLAIATGLGDALPNNEPPGADASAVLGAGERQAASGEVPRAPGAGALRPAVSFAAPYRAAVVNDLLLDANGIKMAKSRGNVVNPWEVVARHGADAVRLFLVAASQLDVPRRFDETAIRETAARFLMTLRNVYSGIFAEYANFGWEPSPLDPAPATRPIIDQWILSRARSVERDVDRLLGDYDATTAARAIMAFVVDDLSNWYVRLTRHRFYAVDGDDNRAAFATLHEVLVVTTRLLAPFAPFLSDLLHRELTGTSVHLAPFTRSPATAGPGNEGVLAAQPDLEAAMDEIRELSRLGRAAREEAGINVRRPLSRLLCVVPPGHVDRVGPLLPLLTSELNVKRVDLLTSADELVRLTAKPNYRHLGKRFAKSTPLAARAVEALSSDSLRAFERGEPIAIAVDGMTHVLEREDFTVFRRATGALVVKESTGHFVAIDPTVTDELRREGLARELVSRVQRTRKEMGLAVSDRILLWIEAAEEIERTVGEYKDWISGEVLARGITVGQLPAGVEYAARSVEIHGLQVRIALTPDQ